jgi:hypothetical protein
MSKITGSDWEFIAAYFISKGFSPVENSFEPETEDSWINAILSMQ